MTGTRPRGRQPWIGVAVASVVILLAAVAGVVAFGDSDDPSGPPTTLEEAVAAADESRHPFAGLSETRIVVGGTRLRVVLADDAAEHYQGLREISDLGPYDGMLFVYDDTDRRTFTMATVPVPLDIAFYGEGGRRVNGFRMTPCPSGIDCPGYPSEVPFRYALETLAGDLPEGALTVRA